MILRAIVVTLLSGLLYAGCGSSDDDGPDAPPPPSMGSVSITTSALPSGQVGVAYDAQLEAEGGVLPYRFEVQPDQPLPSGLAMDLDGHITGMPTASGTTTIGFTVVDSGNPSQGAVRDLQLTVAQ